MVERNHRHAVDFALQLLQRFRQHVAVEDVDVGDRDMHALVRKPFGSGMDLGLESAHEGVVAQRQDKPETVLAAAGKARG